MSWLPYLLIGAFALAMVVVAVTRRGKNLLDAVAPIDGEVVHEELDLELTHRDRQVAVFSTPVFVKAWARRTSHRLILTQAGLGSATKVVRYVIYFRPPTPDPSGWRDGVSTFVLDPAQSGVDDSGTLRLSPLHQPMNMPTWVGVRGAIAGLAEQVTALRG